MEQPPQFHQFPHLPGELRLKIWHLVLYTPRALSINCRRSRVHRQSPFAVESYSSTTPVPALLHTTRESRHEALSFYSASFETPKSKSKSSKSLIYISFPYDTLHISDHILVHLPKDALQNIRYMVLDVRDAAYFDFFNMECLRSMEVLETLELLIERREEITHGGMRDRDIGTLIEDFEGSRRVCPEWNCPDVRIVDKSTRELIITIQGGAGMYLQDEEE